jgi:hypothetical protein
MDIFEIIGEWIKTHQMLSIAIGGALGIVISLIKPERVKAVGRAFSDLLKRIPIVGPMLEKKIEVIVDNFEDGMKSDDNTQILSESDKKVDLEALKDDINKKYPNNLGGDK